MFEIFALHLESCSLEDPVEFFVAGVKKKKRFKMYNYISICQQEEH